MPIPASQELIHQDSQGPVVCRNVMTFVQDDLWGYVLWGATKSPCFLSKSYFLCKAKVDLGEGAGECQGRASEGMSAMGSAPLEVKQGRKEDSSWEFSPN